MPKREITKEHFFLNYTALILLIIFLIIPFAFFFLLGANVSGESFGLAELFFSLSFGVLATIFLLWVRSLSLKNPYLGALIGLVVLAFSEYALFVKYYGFFTTIFAVISAIIVLVFIGMNFFKGLKIKKSVTDDYYEENPTS